jgi:hypothetical protein
MALGVSERGDVGQRRGSVRKEDTRAGYRLSGRVTPLITLGSSAMLLLTPRDSRPRWSYGLS